MVENSITNQVIERTSVPVEVIAGEPASKLERFGIPAGVGAGILQSHLDLGYFPHVSSHHRRVIWNSHLVNLVNAEPTDIDNPRINLTPRSVTDLREHPIMFSLHSDCAV